MECHGSMEMMRIEKRRDPLWWIGVFVGLITHCPYCGGEIDLAADEIIRHFCRRLPWTDQPKINVSVNEDGAVLIFSSQRGRRNQSSWAASGARHPGGQDICVRPQLKGGKDEEKEMGQGRLDECPSEITLAVSAARQSKGTRYFRVASERGPYSPFNPPPGAYCEEACVGQEHWKGV